MRKMRVGSIVRPKRVSKFRLACGSGRYADAVVVSMKPFVLVSREADMMWRATVRSRYFRVCGKAETKDLRRCKMRLETPAKRGK